MDRWARVVAIVLVWFFGTGVDTAGEVRVAVASNFAPTLHELTRDFERTTDDRVLISSGSTGKLYAQISNGAPFEIFLAADAARPRRLEQDGTAVAETRFTYALLEMKHRHPHIKRASIFGALVRLGLGRGDQVRPRAVRRELERLCGVVDQRLADPDNFTQDGHLKEGGHLK